MNAQQQQMWAIWGQKEQMPELEWRNSVGQITAVMSVLETLCRRHSPGTGTDPQQRHTVPLATSALSSQHPKTKATRTSHIAWSQLEQLHSRENDVKSQNLRIV